MIHFICSAPIQYRFPGLSEYESFDLVAQGKKSAILKENAFKFLQSHSFPFSLSEVKTVLTATSGQTYETGKLFLNLHSMQQDTIYSTPLLNNIRFSMTDLITPTSFYANGLQAGMNQARQIFIEKLSHDIFDESREDLAMRMKMLLQLARESKQDVLCIGHAFFLKILENYAKNPHIFSNRSALIAAFVPNERPYGPLQGFTLS